MNSESAKIWSSVTKPANFRGPVFFCCMTARRRAGARGGASDAANVGRLLPVELRLVPVGPEAVAEAGVEPEVEVEVAVEDPVVAAVESVVVVVGAAASGSLNSSSGLSSSLGPKSMSGTAAGNNLFISSGSIW